MKRLKSMLVCLCMVVMCGIAVGCSTVRVTLTTEKTTLKPGESTQIIMDIESEDIRLEIIDGEEYATLSKDGVLTIRDDAKVGEVVTTVATKGKDVVSDELDITIAPIPVESITATSTATSSNIDRNGVVFLNYTTTPTKITETITWQITEGSNYATITNNVLQINANAPYDAEIKVQAKGEGTVVSNELTFTVASVPLTGLSISSTPGAGNVDRNSQIVLSYTATPTNTTESITFEITEGDDYATIINGNILKISENIPYDTEVKVRAKGEGTVVSSELTFVVPSVPLTGLSISSTPGAGNVDRNSQIVLSYTATPTNTTESITFEITEGDDYATIINGNILKISENIPYDTEVKVRAKGEGTVVSSELAFVVPSVPLTGLSISSTPGAGNVNRNSEIALRYTATPTNTTEVIGFEIVEGEDYATLSGDTLTINSDAPFNAVIKVKAYGETRDSQNELTFTVVASSQELRTIFTELDGSVDAASSTTKTLTVEVLNGNMENVLNETINYTIIEGAEFLEIEHDNGYTCDLKAIGHGTAQVKVSVAGAADKIVTVNCVKAPNSIALPEALTTKTGIEFATGQNQEITGFAFNVVGEKVCEDLTYNIQKWNGTEYVDSTEGTYDEATNKLTFTEIGKFKLIAVSASGSSRYVSREIVFNVNEGVNVDTYEEFRTNVINGIPVNIMNLENKNGDYNYNLVPLAILNGTQNVDTYKSIKMHVAGKNVKINGNGFGLDVSKIGYYETVEGFDGKGNAISAADFGALIQTWGTSKEEADHCLTDADNTQDLIDAKKQKDLTQANYFVEIRNLDIIGNAHYDGRIGDHEFVAPVLDPLNFNPGTSLVYTGGGLGGLQGRLRSVFEYGINIGADYLLIANQVTLDNLHVTGFNRGIRVNHGINSTLSNTYVGDCFVNGIELAASEITLTNMTYGLSGAAGIEITPNHSGLAGLNFSKNQSVTFAGDIIVDSSALTNGTTPYLELFAATNGGNLTQLVLGAMAQTLNGGADPDFYAKMANVITDPSDVHICIIGLIFISEKEANNSELKYSNELNDGIVKFADIQPNDNHKYVELNLEYGGMNLGKALLLNLKYLTQQQ